MEVAGASRFGRMILTCPECATSYFVDDSKIPAEGRAVKCAACGARWTAHRSEELELEVSEEEGAVAREAAPAEEPEPAVSELPGEALPRAFRQRAETERRVREAATTGIVWAAGTVTTRAQDCSSCLAYDAACPVTNESTVTL